MDLACGYRAKSKMKVRRIKGALTVGLDPDSVLIIKLPDSRVLRTMSRSLFLAMFILALPSIGSIVRDASSTSNLSEEYPGDLIHSELLPMVFKDLIDEGLLKNSQKGLILSSGTGDSLDNLRFLNDKGIELVVDSDIERKMVIANEAFDFLFASASANTEFLDRIVKVDGIMVFPLGNNYQDFSYEFSRRSNYKIVYLRQFDSAAVIAMKKIDDFTNPQGKRRLLGVTEEAKRKALNGLEEVMLEPPRKALTKVGNSKNIKFLSDLLGVSYESYKRRIFITDENNGVTDWFYENYPRRNRFFEVHDLEDELDANSGVSEWMVKNLKEEDYVVMKAEAGVVEEMMKEKTIGLVDELFLECSNQWGDSKKKMMKRAYWQCVALYGKLRDEGVAVHQWWG